MADPRGLGEANRNHQLEHVVQPAQVEPGLLGDLTLLDPQAAKCSGQLFGPAGDRCEAGSPGALALQADHLAVPEQRATPPEQARDDQREILHGAGHSPQLLATCFHANALTTVM